jgi:hypothetical protein
MKKLLPLVKISAKRIFKSLRSKAPIFCPSIKQPINIGKLFLNHISYARRREIRDIIERLIMLSLVEEIIEEGKCIETRQSSGKTFYKISHQINKNHLSVIIEHTGEREGYTLLSCFKE